ncbi:MAG: Plug domain-containing protein, partial [Woeseia sp.]
MKILAKISVGITAALALGNIALPGVALAQQSADGTIEEIVVTSRKRAENLQEIPDSITVFNEAAIERAGISRFGDFAALTPNLSSYGNFRPNLANITIRGLTSTQLGEPPIAFVVDGITVPNLEFM